MGNSFLPLQYLACTTNQRSMLFGYLLHLLVGHQEPLLCFIVLRAAEFDGVGYNVSGDTTMVDVQSLLEDFLYMFMRPACSVHEAFFLYRRKTSGHGTASISARLRPQDNGIF